MMLPCISVMDTSVLLNVAKMFAMPELMFLACLALMIFFASAPSPRSSAAVGAAPATGSAGLAASLAGASAGAPPAAAGAFSGFSAFSGLSALGLSACGFFSFFGFVSSAITQILLVDAGLGLRVALHADGLPRAFARTRVGGGALATDGEA